MSTSPDNGESYPGRSFSISQLLYAAKRKLQGTMLGGRIATTMNKAEVDVLEQGVLEVLSMVRSVRNNFAPINRIPPEILSLIPDYWCSCDMDERLITLTHVCHGWRELFVSRSSLWVSLDCMNVEKTHVYIERSKSSPLEVILERSEDGIYCDDALLMAAPHINRLGSLTVCGPSAILADLNKYFTCPTPLLRKLKIDLEFDRNRASNFPGHFSMEISHLCTN